MTLMCYSDYDSEPNRPEKRFDIEHLKGGEIMDFANIVTNIGFPIACVMFLGIYVKDLTEAHKEEVTLLTEKLSAQTITIQRLVDKIDELLRKMGDNNENE